MSQRSSILVWETVLDDTEWEREESLDDLLPSKPHPIAPPSEPTSPFRRWIAIIALLAVVLGTVHIWREAQTGVAAIEAEIQHTVEAEGWSQQSGNLAASRSYVDGDAAEEWKNHFYHQEDAGQPGKTGLPSTAVLDEVRLRSGLAMAQVTVNDQMVGAYRETRFYRETPEGWLRTAPSPEFWGRDQVLETEHFLIRYRQADERFVSKAAEHLDAMVPLLRDDLGLPRAMDKLVVQVVPEPLSSVGYLRFEDAALIVPSPLLIDAPEEVPEGMVLVQSITNPLVTWLWQESRLSVADGETAQVLRSQESDLRHVQRGVQIWQANAGGGLHDSWYTHAVNGLYGEALEHRKGHRVLTVTEIQKLCREDPVWRFSVPAAIQLASRCLDPRWQQSLPQLPAAPDSLGQLVDADGWEEGVIASPRAEWMSNVAAATVVEYVVLNYGRDVLPTFVDGLSTHDSWESLVPDLFGIPATEFETGWLSYLSDQYGHTSM